MSKFKCYSFNDLNFAKSLKFVLHVGLQEVQAILPADAGCCSRVRICCWTERRSPFCESGVEGHVQTFHNFEECYHWSAALHIQVSRQDQRGQRWNAACREFKPWWVVWPETVSCWICRSTHLAPSTRPPWARCHCPPCLAVRTLSPSVSVFSLP